MAVDNVNEEGPYCNICGRWVDYDADGESAPASDGSTRCRGCERKGALYFVIVSPLSPLERRFHVYQLSTSSTVHDVLIGHAASEGDATRFADALNAIAAGRALITQLNVMRRLFE